MIICGRAIGIYCHLLLHQSPLLHAPGLQCGKVDIIILEGEEEIIVYAYVDIDDGNSE